MSAKHLAIHPSRKRYRSKRSKPHTAGLDRRDLVPLGHLSNMKWISFVEGLEGQKNYSKGKPRTFAQSAWQKPHTPIPRRELKPTPPQSECSRRRGSVMVNEALRSPKKDLTSLSKIFSARACGWMNWAREWAPPRTQGVSGKGEQEEGGSEKRSSWRILSTNILI